MWNVSNFGIHFNPYRLVCGTCSNNSWYAPGYTDQKVRMCDPCYKQWMSYKVSAHNINKTSVFSSYFTVPGGAAPTNQTS